MSAYSTYSSCSDALFLLTPRFLLLAGLQPGRTAEYWIRSMAARNNCKLNAKGSWWVQFANSELSWVTYPYVESYYKYTLNLVHRAVHTQGDT